MIFRIKEFDNNYCPQEFEYPDSQILIIPEFIKGTQNMVELYDEYYCIDTK